MKGTKNPISGQADGKIRSHGNCDEAPTKEQHQYVNEQQRCKINNFALNRQRIDVKIANI